MSFYAILFWYRLVNLVNSVNDSNSKNSNDVDSFKLKLCCLICCKATTVFHIKVLLSGGSGLLCLFKKIFWKTSVLTVGPLIPLFRTSGDICPSSKPDWFPYLHASSPECNGFLRFTSGTKPAELLATIMVC